MRTNKCMIVATKKGNDVTWRLKSGPNGAGRVIHTVTGWDNGVSADAAFRIFKDYAKRNNLEIVNLWSESDE